MKQLLFYCVWVSVVVSSPCHISAYHRPAALSQKDHWYRRIICDFMALGGNYCSSGCRGRENYQTPGREIGEVPEGPGYTHQTQQSVFLLLLLLRLCISMNMPAEGWGWGCTAVRVNGNKLQAQVRYTHITCWYLWINRPEQLIVGETSTVPMAGSLPPSWVKTLRTFPSSLQIPKGNRRSPELSLLRGLLPSHLHLPPLTLPMSSAGLLGGNLYKHCTFDLCVQSLTYTRAR